MRCGKSEEEPGRSEARSSLDGRAKHEVESVVSEVGGDERNLLGGARQAHGACPYGIFQPELGLT